MIPHGGEIKRDYEPARLMRYGNTRQTAVYTQEEYNEAYWAWALYPYGREVQWDFWCDARDRVPPGTNAKIRANFSASRIH